MNEGRKEKSKEGRERKRAKERKKEGRKEEGSREEGREEEKKRKEGRKEERKEEKERKIEFFFCKGQVSSRIPLWIVDLKLYTVIRDKRLSMCSHGSHQSLQT
jgi:hypothetical protein